MNRRRCVFQCMVFILYDKFVFSKRSCELNSMTIAKEKPQNGVRESACYSCIMSSSKSVEM